jgi:hypothetical protein
MVFNSLRAPIRTVAVRLLDSAQGHPLQEWRFSDRLEITVGRSDENDITIADQQVSRLHAKLVFRDGQWSLISLGRNGTLVDDRVISELNLDGTTIFRLGPSGPTFRFEMENSTVTQESGGTETISNFGPDVLAMLEVDQMRKLQEVEQITENTLFKDLMDQSRSMKARRQETKET